MFHQPNVPKEPGPYHGGHFHPNLVPRHSELPTGPLPVERIHSEEYLEQVWKILIYCALKSKMQGVRKYEMALISNCVKASLPWTGSLVPPS